jgi:AcrR family transcriptional regulator
VTPVRRIGAETSVTRSRLLDVTEQLMLDEGYASVSSRRVAAKAGVKAPLVHYYFPTLDDLFVAVFRRQSDSNLQRLAADLEKGPPLRVIWDYACDRKGTALMAEFVALANHRKAIQAEIAEAADRFRRVQMEALDGVLEGYGVDTEVFPPEAVVVMMTALPVVLVSEEVLGVRIGHPATRAMVEHLLERYEGASGAGPAEGTG